MARKKISEFKAKSILLDDSYQGIKIDQNSNLESLIQKLSDSDASQTYVVKVDQGEKKRFKRGLIKVAIPKDQILPAIIELRQKGFSQFLLEKYLPHADELYLSLEQEREGVKMLFSNTGGVDIESANETLQQFLITQESDIPQIANKISLDKDFLLKLYTNFVKNYFALLEINPLVKDNNELIMLDCAVLVDDAGKFMVDAWTEQDFVTDKISTPEELEVAKLDANTPAALKLQVLNPDGAIGMLLSSGGASIVIADEIYVKGMSNSIINYGEYSGGPTREETHQYARNVLSLLLKSPAANKILILAGGMANFTDVYQTFMGIVDALGEVTGKLQAQHIKVFVRRGGPNEEKGLNYMKNFLTENNLFGCVYGSDIELTKVIHEALSYRPDNS